MGKERLQQYLSSTGAFASRNELMDALRNREIKVDGKVVDNPAYFIKPDKTEITWQGKPLKSVDETIYILIHKPVGFLSSRLAEPDFRLRKRSVFDLLSKEKRLDGPLGRSLFCVGRLDEDTSGLLIITNDGQLGSYITRPDSNIKKTYEVELQKPINDFAIEQIMRGVPIRVEVDGRFVNYTTKPAELFFGDSSRSVRIVISEGKKREIRLMFQKLGNRVVKLKRIAIGKLSLDELMILPGEYFYVEKEMIESQLK